MYNNYYDGNAKYGAGSTMGSSLFVQNNYFRNCKNPMLSSNQGTDALGEGTFSGENGGIIKASGNVIVGAQKIMQMLFQKQVILQMRHHLMHTLQSQQMRKFHLHIRL